MKRKHRKIISMIGGATALGGVAVITAVAQSCAIGEGYSVESFVQDIDRLSNYSKDSSNENTTIMELTIIHTIEEQLADMGATDGSIQSMSFEYTMNDKIATISNLTGTLTGDTHGGQYFQSATEITITLDTEANTINLTGIESIRVTVGLPWTDLEPGQPGEPTSPTVPWTDLEPSQPGLPWTDITPSDPATRLVEYNLVSPLTKDSNRHEFTSLPDEHLTTTYNMQMSLKDNEGKSIGNFGKNYKELKYLDIPTGMDWHVAHHHANIENAKLYTSEENNLSQRNINNFTQISIANSWDVDLAGHNTDVFNFDVSEEINSFISSENIDTTTHDVYIDNVTFHLDGYTGTSSPVFWRAWAQNETMSISQITFQVDQK